jgi:hypothetical protein
MSIEEEKSADDVFTEAFDRLAETGEAPAPVAEEEAPPPADASAPVDGVGVAEASADDAVESEAAPDGDNPDEPQAPTEAKAPAPEQPAKPSEQDIIDRLAQAVKERVQPPQPQQPQVDQQQEYQPQPVLTQEDYQTLQAFDKDWPDVSKAINLILKEQTHAVVNHVFKEFAQEFRPVAQQVMAMRQERHVEQLHTKVTDYDDIRDKVVDWAMQQPSYLRDAYGRVIQNGTPDEVADLIQRYRMENAPPPAPAAPQAAPAPKQLSPAVKKAAAALAPVQSKRSNVVRMDDPGDFEGAFSRFADMM